MSENESASKKERKFYDLGRDRLSELPSGIIDIILSFLPIRDAVRTSILSKQYRYTWNNLPNLVFDLFHLNYLQCKEKFLINVLKRHKGPIHKFEMFAGMEKSWPIVAKRLILFHKNEIRELLLKLDPWCNGYYTKCFRLLHVGSVAYSCKNLTHLQLHRCELGPPPLTFTGFLFLRCLILVDVKISLSDVESIVANSPLIETLKLNRILSDIEKPVLKINAPNLKYFDLGTKPGNCMQIHFSAPFLSEMCVSVIGCNDGYLRENCSTYNYTNFFGGCTSLQILKGNYFTKVMSYGIDSCQYSFVLPCLEVIELSDVQFGVVEQMSIVARLVTGAPNLQKLNLTCDPSKEEHASEAPDVSYMDFLSAPDFKWEKLRNITMRNLIGLATEMEFLRLLLENSPVLERVNLYTEGLNFQESENLRAQVLKCNLASPNFTLWDLFVI